MSLFDVAKLFSPVGGAIGGAMAVHRSAPSQGWMWAAIPLGLAFGIVCYRGLIRLAVGRYDKNLNIPSWRVAAILGISAFAPVITGTLSYGLVRSLLYVVT